MSIADLISPGVLWDGTAGSGGAAPTESASLHGSGFAHKAIGGSDAPPFMWLDGTVSVVEIFLICDHGDAAWLEKATFYCEGTTLDVSTQSYSEDNGSIGFSCALRHADFARDGIARIYGKIIPVNGYERLVGPIDVYVYGTGVSPDLPVVRYCNHLIGSNSYDGTQATFGGGSVGPWQNIQKACVSATSASGTKVYCADDEPYVEDSNAGPFNNNTRPIQFLPMPGHSPTITRSLRVVEISGGGAWRPPAAKLYFKGFTFDASKMANVYTPLGIFEDCSFIDPNGVQGPIDGLGLPIGYFNPAEASQAFFIDTQSQINCLINCTVTNYLSTQCRLLRNCTLNVSADSYFLGAPSSNSVIVNTRVFMPDIFYQRRHYDPYVTIASKSYDGVNNRTTFTYTNTAGSGTITTVGGTATFTAAHGLRTGDTIRITSGPQVNEIKLLSLAPTATTANFSSGFSVDQVAQTWEKIPTISTVAAAAPPLQGMWFLTGALVGVSGPADSGGYSDPNGGFPMYSQTMPSGTSSAAATTVVMGDASAAVVGDTVRVWVIFHPDTFQVGAGSTSQTNIENVIAQRYIVDGVTFQPIFIQAQTFVGAGTISTTGASLTCSTNHALIIHDFVRVTNGSQSGEFRKTISIDSTTTATLSSAFSVDQSGRSWNKSKCLKDTAFQLCVFNRTGTGAELSQFQHGHEHIVIRQTTHVGTGILMRTTDNGFGIEGSAFVDSVFGSNATLVTQPPISASVVPTTANLRVDNNHFTAVSTLGTNASGPSAVTLDAYYRPTGGTVINTIPLPRMQWDVNGQPLAMDGTDIVGAAQLDSSPVAGGTNAAGLLLGVS